LTLNILDLLHCFVSSWLLWHARLDAKYGLQAVGGTLTSHLESHTFFFLIIQSYKGKNHGIVIH